MTTYVHLYLAEFFLEGEIFQSCRENQNTQFMFSNFFPKILRLMRYCGKIQHYLVKCFTATLAKTEKLCHVLSVITFCLAKLCVQSRPWANEHTFVNMQHRALYMKTNLRFIVAGDINFP
jgi:hypothetical protein